MPTARRFYLILLTCFFRIQIVHISSGQKFEEWRKVETCGGRGLELRRWKRDVEGDFCLLVIGDQQPALEQAVQSRMLTRTTLDRPLSAVSTRAAVTEADFQRTPTLKTPVT